MSLVLDTSFVLALIDGDDREHDRCAAVAGNAREAFVVPLLTLTEIDYFLSVRGRTDVWQSFVQEIQSGAYVIHAPDALELVRAADLERRYEDLRLGVVDASIVATCETLGETKLATLDRRHFSVVRPRHCDRLTLLPA